MPETERAQVDEVAANGASRPADIFDNLDKIRLSLEAGPIGTEEVITKVAVGKPKQYDFVRVHRDPAMSIATAVFVDPVGETYLVLPEAWSLLPSGVKPVQLVLAVNQHGVPLLWRLALGDGSGRTNAWHETARAAAELAKTHWVKVVADMQASCNRVYRACGNLPDPIWPQLPFSELLKLAFGDRVIKDADHPAVRQALGYTL